MDRAGKADEIRTGRVRRAAPLVGLATRSAVGRVSAVLRQRLGQDGAVLAFRERDAARYAERLGSARGALMKAGQLLSFVQPPLGRAESWSPYQDALAALRDDIDPMDGTLTAAVIEAELGQPPEALFASFDPVPFAAASIGQVHAATAADGTPLAVKVQYPGVAEAIEADLANAELLATMLKLAQSTLPRMPGIDAHAVADELGDRLREELDYVREQANLEEFRSIYAHDPRLHIPATHPQWCSPRVLTMDRAEGRSWEDALDAPQALRNQWGVAINDFFFRSLYSHGVFHADPHPGNYRFHDDGSVTILDFGCVSRLDAESLAAVVDVAETTIHGDADGLREAFVRAGFVRADGPAADDLLAFYRPTFRCMTDPQPFRMTTGFTDGILEALNPLGPHGDVARAFALPPKLMLTTRIYVGLFSVLAALEAEADWRSGYDADIRAYRARTEEVHRP